MSVVIRLQRSGSKKKPYYKVIAIDSRKKTTGMYLDNIGFYDPMLLRGDGIKFKISQVETLNKWLSCGASVSGRVAKLIHCDESLTIDVTRFLPNGFIADKAEREKAVAVRLEKKKNDKIAKDKLKVAGVES